MSTPPENGHNPHLPAPDHSSGSHPGGHNFAPGQGEQPVQFDKPGQFSDAGQDAAGAGQYGSAGGSQPASGSYDSAQSGFGQPGQAHASQQQGQPYGAEPYAQQQGQPYGTQPYAQQQGQPYGTQPYAQQQGQPYGTQPCGQNHPQQFGGPSMPYAHWGKRVGAYLIDSLLLLPFYVVGMLFIPRYEVYRDTGETVRTGGQPILFALVMLLATAFALWNMVWKQGKTGQSIGKGVLGTKLVSEQTGQPLGPGMTFVRQLAHILDSLPCYLGFLWPLWDAKRQTFADKVMSSVVVDAPKDAQR